jgi:hypothetical protein
LLLNNVSIDFSSNTAVSHSNSSFATRVTDLAAPAYVDFDGALNGALLPSNII